VDIHHILWFRLVMAGLKSFLYGIAPSLGISPLALYERQRALVNLGAIKSAGGRGPGSGVPLTAENFAAVLISLLATENLSEVDDAVVALCNATAKPWRDPRKDLADTVRSKGKPTTFKEALGRVLSDQVEKPTIVLAVRVLRPGRGQIDYGISPLMPIATDFPARGADAPGPIQISAEISKPVLDQLKDLTCSALKAESEEDEE
jgi:hypothetical protein